jgi:hypothetical protein
LLVMGDGEAEAFPAGLAERGSQCVSVLEGVPHPAWSCLEHLVVSLVVGEGYLRPRSVPDGDGGDGGFAVVVGPAIAQGDVGTEVEAGEEPHHQCFPGGAWVQRGGALLGLAAAVSWRRRTPNPPKRTATLTNRRGGCRIAPAR